jgi:hypothetical protein
MGGFGAKWTSGARLSIRQGDEDGALLGERSAVAGEGVWVVSVGCRSGNDVTQVIRLFFCDRNDLLFPLPVLCLPMLLFEDCGEGVFF